MNLFKRFKAKRKNLDLDELRSSVQAEAGRLTAEREARIAQAVATVQQNLAAGKGKVQRDGTVIVSAGAVSFDEVDDTTAALRAVFSSAANYDSSGTFQVKP